MQSSLKIKQKIKFFKKNKLFLKKKKKNFIYKKLKHLKFVLKRLHINFFFRNYKNNLKIYHNKNFHFFFIKKYLAGQKPVKIMKNLTYIKNNYIFITRKLRKKKKIFRFENANSKKAISPLSNFFYKIVTTTFNNGKKSNWYLILNNLFEYMSYSLNYSISILLSKIFIRLFTRVELKKVVARKRITYIPFFIKTNRSFFLALKWIFLSISKNITKTSLQNKLYLEFIDLLTNKTCFSILKLEENNIESFNNRANIHYRWQKTR
jgi:ribosomal protein S7